ncbi:fungal specific transcription factor domain-containing protein [Aspergillus undulatus]|uniref:fungal specific transcription factor domain-containing protein n=1 Tax=Aspergillus undulatus TaxID=1810928 RepID=UPI003CCCEF5E
MVSERARGIRTRVQPQPLKKLPRLQKRKEPSDIQFAVPPRKVADNLLNLYWDFVDSAYPWLDRFSIESAYETLWSKDGGASIMDERVLHCFLNLMFATSCVASQGEPPLSRYQSSITFFDRAQQLMSYDLTDMYNFEMIQILLLTAVYLQHDKEPQKCFRSIGTAIHIAQELGLHLPETTEAISDPRERALARQVWNGCVIMDRISCMTFGCALKVPQGNAREGLNALMTRTLENTALPSKVNFYVSFCRLHYIIGEVLETFYISNEDIVDEPHHPASKGYFEKFASLFRIESELISWAVDLHRFFQNPSDAQDPTPSKHITREANILRARYLSVRLLLFRPFLLQINQKPAQNNASSTRLYTDDQILSDVVLRCQLNCTRAAADMIAFIARNRPEQTQTQAYILPSNWYTVSYIYMAVTTLLAAKMSQQIMEHFSATHLPGLLNSARDILKDYEAHATLASRCSSVLRLIDENIDKGAVGGVVEPAAYPAMVPQHNNGDMVGQDTTNGIQEPQNFSENLDWVDKYAFDWNDWPTFFAQLDCDISPVGRW